MKQVKDHTKVKKTHTVKVNYFGWVALVLIVVCSLITGLIVNFFNNIYYSNLLLQANNKAGSAQTELGKEQYDVKFLLKNINQQINCYELRSSYVRNLCYKSENGSTSTPL